MEQIARLKARLSEALRRGIEAPPPGAAYAAGALPPSLQAARTLAAEHQLAALLPYEAYDPETQLFYNAESLGFVLEAAPAVGLTEERLNVLSGLFTQGLKPGTVLQIMLYGSPDVRPLLQRWASAREATGNAVFRFLAKQRVEYLKRGNWRSLLSDQPLLLRDFRLFVSLTRALPAGGTALEAEGLQRTREMVRGTLASAGIPTEPLDAEAL
nr:conjugal transfer protein TraC [Gammaproteobacteria bacterium]